MAGILLGINARLMEEKRAIRKPQLPSWTSFPVPDASDEKFNSRPVVPTNSYDPIPSLVANATGDGI
jgi:hypothetical protein